MASSSSHGASRGRGAASRGTGNASLSTGTASQGTGSASREAGSASLRAGGAWRDVGGTSQGTGGASRGMRIVALAAGSDARRTRGRALAVRGAWVVCLYRIAPIASDIATKAWPWARKGERSARGPGRMSASVSRCSRDSDCIPTNGGAVRDPFGTMPDPFEAMRDANGEARSITRIARRRVGSDAPIEPRDAPREGRHASPTLVTRTSDSDSDSDSDSRFRLPPYGPRTPTSDSDFRFGPRTSDLGPRTSDFGTPPEAGVSLISDETARRLSRPPASVGAVPAVVAARSLEGRRRRARRRDRSGTRSSSGPWS